MNKLEILISEILGVPKEMTTSKVKEMVEMYVEKFILELKKRDFNTEVSNLKIYTIFENSYIDMKGDISIETKLIPDGNMGGKKISLVSAGAKYMNKLTDDNKIKISSSKVFIDIRLFISIDENLNLGEVAKEFNDNEFKNNLVRVMYHEIKHLMDVNYYPIRSVDSMADYNLKSNKRIMSDSFNKFMFYAYLTTVSENLVRNTELYGDIKTNNVLKKDFYSFLTNTKQYKRLKEIQNYSWETFVNDLLNEKEKLIKYCKFENINNDEEFLLAIQKRFLTLIKKQKMDNIDAFIDGMELSRYHKYAKHLSFLKDVDKFKTFKQYFDYELKRMKISASKTIKKMGKVYDLAKDNTNVNQLMQKINSNMSEQSIYDPEMYDRLKINNKL